MAIERVVVPIIDRVARVLTSRFSSANVNSARSTFGIHEVSSGSPGPAGSGFNK